MEKHLRKFYQWIKQQFLKHYYQKAAQYKRVVTFEDEAELHDGEFIFQTILTLYIPNM